MRRTLPQKLYYTMLVNVYGAKCQGIEAVKVTVEVDIQNGIGIHLVGLADTAVKESLLRTITALQANGFHIPGRKIVINLAPADQQKKGSGYDLPIALGIIAASGQKSMPFLGQRLIMGELGLDGSVRDISGALAFAQMARDAGFDGCVLPVRSALEASAIKGIDIYGVSSITDAIRALSLPPEGCSDLLVRDGYVQGAAGGGLPPEQTDMADIIGQDAAKRGIEIAAAGGHNVIMIGAPGAGKSSLAKAMAGILPPLTDEESLTTTKIYSVAGKLDAGGGLIRRRPVRSPHCSISLAAMIGGGSGDMLLPGEVSLANGGVLFIDEINQMPKSIVEALRGPLEDRVVTLSRLKSKVTYPASFMLVAASNPCPCGYWGEGDRCTCTPGQRLSYISRLSGPILDRIDIQLWIHPVNPLLLINKDRMESSGIRNGRSLAGEARAPESSAEIARRVAKARDRQGERFRHEGISTNAEMTSKMIERYCPLDSKCRDGMERLMEGMGFSARAYTRIIKVARTIADLDEEDGISIRHLAEAASYRILDKPPVLR